MATTQPESPRESAGLGDILADAAATAAAKLEPGLAQPMQDGSIAAYYSLAFPNFTYYLQTLDVTIGRRLVSTGTSEDGAKSVDVDLGPLKSVSRLHAKITYDDDDERWVLVIYGRNGAWVDGVWAGPGHRVPLESRSQIQIATRSFSFILPPTDPPDESPMTSSPTSTTRARSPSLDATSLSPASSPVSVHSPTPLDPEHTAEPEIVQPSKPKLIRKRAASDSDQDMRVSPVLPQESKPCPAPDPDPELELDLDAEPEHEPEPEADLEPEHELEPEPKLTAPKPAAPKAAKAAVSKSKPKSKASTALTKPSPAEASEAAVVSHPKPAPYVRIPGQPEPQKPAATLSQLCYRAIKALDGRATLQSILCWIMDTYEWYRAHAGEKWESSVRHNLSSNAAFVKSQRNSNEPGKGAFWCIDPNHIATFEAVEAKLNAGPPAKPGKGKLGGKAPTVDATSIAPKVKKEPPASAAAPVLVAVPILPASSAVPLGQQASKGVKPQPPPLMSTKPLASPFTTKPLPAKAIASPFTTRPLQHKPPFTSHAARPLIPAYTPPMLKQEAVPVPVPPLHTSIPAVTPAPATSVVTAPSEGAMHVPIVVGPLPASYPLPAGAEPPPIVLHEGRLILAPKAFAHLTPDEIKEFEKLGAQKALAALQVHVVKFLKEQMRLRGRGRARGRGAPGRGAAVGRGPPKTLAEASAIPTPSSTSTPDVAMSDVGVAETPEESTAPRSQSQVRPRSNSSEAADVPAPKRARVDSSVA